MDDRKVLGWWVATTPDGETWATERYEGDTIEQARLDALLTFGAGTTIEAE